jgi:hypothetical protein
MDVKDRKSSTTTDTYGIDPLLDKSYRNLFNLIAVRSHLVTSDERGRPELIAYREYGSVKLWWVILVKNAMICPYDVVESMVLDIPSYSDVMTTLNRSVRYAGLTQDSNVSVSI